MPGYNHYPWCLCGWCDSQGRNGYSSEQNERYFDEWSAKRFLKGEGVTRSFTACFVQPNASCPICGERVFFYANKSGSRVFFDELGWPWPKHSCTDRRTVRTSPPPVMFSPPLVRARGMRIEIVEAVKRAGFSPLANFISFHKAKPASLFRIVSVARVGFLNLVEAVAVSPECDEPFHFEFTSAKVVPEQEDFFSFRDGKISLLDGSLTSQSYQAKEIAEVRFRELAARSNAEQNQFYPDAGQRVGKVG